MRSSSTSCFRGDFILVEWRQKWEFSVQLFDRDDLAVHFRGIDGERGLCGKRRDDGEREKDEEVDFHNLILAFDSL